MTIKAVVCDLDGTLLNTYEDLADAVNYGLEKLGFPARPSDNFKNYAGNGTEMMIKRALPETNNDDETIANVKKFYLEYYNIHSKDKTRPYDGVIETLKNLKKSGYKLAVVSNKIDCMTKIVVDDYFPDIFDYVTGQRDGIAAKPAPDMVYEALKNLNLSKDECIFVGDSDVDALTGVNAGLYMVGVLWGFRTAEELTKNGANTLISEASELEKIVRTL